MPRFKDVSWNVGGEVGPDGKVIRWPDNEIAKQTAVLMDIRDELQRLNHIFQCFNFTSLPKVVKQIRANLSRIPMRKPK